MPPDQNQLPVNQPVPPQPPASLPPTPPPTQIAIPQPVLAPAPPATPDWQKMYKQALLCGLFVPGAGLALGEVMYRKAKQAGDEYWRKKARRAINIGALMGLVYVGLLFGYAGIQAAHDDSPQGRAASDAYYAHDQSPTNGAIPSRDNIILYTTTVDLGLSDYYAKNVGTKDAVLTYPTLQQLNDPTWRQQNGIKFSGGEIPNGDLPTISFIDGQPTKGNQYGYLPVPTGCQNTQADPCTGYKLLAATKSGIYTDDHTEIRP